MSKLLFKSYTLDNLIFFGGRMSKRLTEIDFIRCIAILSVIAIHITGSYSMNSTLIYLWNQSMRYAVPIFILLSGLVLYYSDMNKDKFSLITFYIKRVNKVFIPYLVWTLIFLIYNNRHELGKIYFSVGSFLSDLGRNLLFGTGYYHLYFIVIILQLYLIYPLLRYLFKKAPFFTLICSLLCSAAFQTIFYLQFFKIRIIPPLTYPYAFLFPVWIFYFVFGMYFVSNLSKWQKRLEYRGLLLFVIWVLNLSFVIAENSFTSPDGTTIKPSVMLFCITSFFLFYQLGLRFKNMSLRISNLITWVSEQSFIIYFCHPLLLGFISTLLYIFGLEILKQRFLGKVILLIITFLLASLFSYIMSFSKATTFFGGVVIKKYKPNKQLGL